MFFIPNNIILNVGPIINLFLEHTHHLNIPRHDVLDIIGQVIDSTSYKDIEVVMEVSTNLVNDLIESYRNILSSSDIEILSTAFIQLIMQLHEHLLASGIFEYDGCSSHYHFKHLLTDGSVLLEFNYIDSENNSE